LGEKIKRNHGWKMLAAMKKVADREAPETSSLARNWRAWNSRLSFGETDAYR